jgi:hypothetical protein
LNHVVSAWVGIKPISAHRSQGFIAAARCRGYGVPCTCAQGNLD